MRVAVWFEIDWRAEALILQGGCCLGFGYFGSGPGKILSTRNLFKGTRLQSLDAQAPFVFLIVWALKNVILAIAATVARSRQRGASW